MTNSHPLTEVEVTQSTPELLPCPFCGGEAETVIQRWGPDVERWGVMSCNTAEHRFHFDCRALDEAEAIAAWNTRSTPDRSAVLEEAAKVAQSYEEGLTPASGRSNICKDGYEDGVADASAAIEGAILALTTTPEPTDPAREDVIYRVLFDWLDLSQELKCDMTENLEEVARKIVAALSSLPTDPAGVSEMADWWKPTPGDPFWMLEAPDGEWLANQHSLLGTRDAAKAIRFPSENHARNHEARMKAGTKWWDAKPTEHKWIEPSLRTLDPVLEVAKEALENFCLAAEYWAGCDEGCDADAASSEIMRSGGAWPAESYDKARAAIQTINERSNHD